MEKHDLTEATLGITFESLSVLAVKINYKGGVELNIFLFKTKKEQVIFLEEFGYLLRSWIELYSKILILLIWPKVYDLLRHFDTVGKFSFTNYGLWLDDYKKSFNEVLLV